MHGIADGSTRMQADIAEVVAVAEQSSASAQEVSTSTEQTAVLRGGDRDLRAGARAHRRRARPPRRHASGSRHERIGAQGAAAAADQLDTMTEQVLCGLREAETEDERVAFWRYLVLVHAGYAKAQARQVATSRVDLHRATSLLAAGCPPQLALRILL